MKLDDLKLFAAVCRYKSFAQAAQELYVSRYTLIRTINNLENVLNRQLLSRSFQGITLTEFGKLFLDYAMPLIEQYDSLLDLSSIYDSSGHITVGVRGSLSSAYYFNKLTSAFCSEHPECDVEIIDCNSFDIESYVLDKRIDFGFSLVPPESSELDYKLLLKQDFMLLVNKKNPLSEAEKITPEMLKDEKLVIIAFSEYSQELLCNYMGGSRTILSNIIFETEDMGLLYNIVNHNKASGLLTNRDAGIGTIVFDNIIAVPVDPKIEARMGIIYRKDKILTRTHELYINKLLKDYSNIYC